MLSMVGRTSFISWRCAPSIVTPIGTPCPSVSRLRFTPLLPRSVGLGPVFFPAQRGFGHCPIHAQPAPVDPVQLIELLDSCLPQLEEDVRFHPLLKAIMRCRVRTQFGLVQGLPLAAGSQHIKNGVGTTAVRHARSSPAKTMRVHMDRQQRLQRRPQLIADPECCCRAVIRCPLPFSFLAFLFVHTSYLITLFG
jgi:hypothetical protein